MHGLEVQAGVEPTHGGFADRRVPVSPLHRSPVFGGKWTESNLLPKGTAFTARRRHQPVLMALPIPVADSGGGCLTCRSPHREVPSRFERAPEAALEASMLEEGRGLDPQWRTTRSLSKRCRSPDRLTFRIGGWRSTRSPCLAAPSVFKAAPASLAGSPSILAYRIGFEPMSSTFGGSRSSAELPVVIAGARHPNRGSRATSHANSLAGTLASPPSTRRRSERTALGAASCSCD